MKRLHEKRTVAEGRKLFAYAALKSLMYFAVGYRQVLWQHSRLADGGHEIRIADPPRHDVHVDMIGNAGSGGAAQVHSNIEALRVVNFAQRSLTALG